MDHLSAKEAMSVAIAEHRNANSGPPFDGPLFTS